MIHRMFDLTGKKALVTGGAVGVGGACATYKCVSYGSVSPREAGSAEWSRRPRGRTRSGTRNPPAAS